MLNGLVQQVVTYGYLIYCTLTGIVVIENGKAAEVGSHDTLMARNGIYAEMYRLQAEQYSAGQSE